MTMFDFPSLYKCMFVTNDNVWLPITLQVYVCLVLPAPLLVCMYVRLVSMYVCLFSAPCSTYNVVFYLFYI